MRYLKNLTSVQTFPGKPWEFTKTDHIPPIVRTDKKIRDAWICNPATEHHVYSLFEGVNENIRVSAPKGDNEGNPPLKLYGLAVDYDAKIKEDELLEGVDRMAPYLPNYYEKTLSGHARFLWVFESPILLPSFSFAVFFLKEIQEKIKLHLLSVGFDKPAFEDPARLFTNSGDWATIHTTPLPSALVQGWLVQISKKFAFKGREFGVEIPYEIVAAKLSETFPRFAEWPGDFVKDSQGPTFWLDGSTSPKSAIVRETGIQTFSAHATKAFYSWADLLGSAFVEEYETKALGNAVLNIFHDGKTYYRIIGDESWKSFDKNDVLSHLKVTRGLSQKPDKSGISTLDRALQYIQDHQSIIGAAPFVFRPAGLVVNDGQRFLNTHTRRVLAPAGQPVKWGENFPYLAAFLTGFFDPAEQLDFFLSWLSYFYKSCYRLAPRSGQNIYIAGAPGVGKTLLNRGVIGKLLGGCAEAKEYLLGEDGFGSELFEVAHWVIDDGSMNASFKSHKLFSEMIKRMAANRTFRYHAKFRIPTMVQWQGRVVVTCNRDEESIRIIPDLELSILDKLMLFRSAELPAVKFGKQEEMEQILSLELPFLARFLLDYEIPAQCQGENRFGVNSYHEKSLVSTAKQSSRFVGFLEILEDWKTTYFVKEFPELEKWSGTAFQLHKAIHADPTAATAMKPYSVDMVTRCLAQLKGKGEKIESDDSGTVRVWTIYRPANSPVTVPAKSTPIPEQNAGSKFLKT